MVELLDGLMKFKEIYLIKSWFPKKSELINYPCAHRS
jgi:hypothetical protein